MNAGTVDQIGLGFRPFYRYGEPGKFHILGIHTSPLGFVKKLPDIWRALPMGAEHTREMCGVSAGECGAIGGVLVGDPAAAGHHRYSRFAVRGSPTQER